MRQEHRSAALIYAKNAKIRPIELYVVRLAEIKPIGKRPSGVEISTVSNTKNCCRSQYVLTFCNSQSI